MTKWMIICNPKHDAVDQAFQELDTIDWKKSNKIKVGDDVYIYVASPVQAIKYKCKVIKTNLSKAEIDNKKFELNNEHYANAEEYMRLHLLETYPDELLPYQDLQQNGLTSVQGANRMSDELVAYIERIVKGNARDAAYPREYVFDSTLPISKWKELLLDTSIFTEKNIALLKRIYLADNHATTCYDLSVEDGGSPSAYNSSIVSLAKKIIKKTGISPAICDEEEAYWPILFWGRERQDKRFEWKLQPKLAKAMQQLYPELINDLNLETERLADEQLIEELKTAKIIKAEDFQYRGRSKKKVEPIYHQGRKSYPRDKKTALNALAHANYCCEINPNHETFIKKNSEVPYTEPHHLVPLAYSGDFEVSLDVEENIVSLCSNCHNHLHYGKDAEKLIVQLYKERQSDLKKVGIAISLEDLLAMY
ncbi:Predicted restriction endonuclease, HNH family [Granulicatella balaenopterae]|uniref:Predicted restriction endonuclease, HNH family n=1 Tax=Granulicatella balaenopterae TaxID=137733 RepID=A0A1H9MD56_9LACT|nr:HNH endonuclease [Granulicatella balaenopterae]SER21700.1 Predicted restriction endonuclease, HNH family [Granulicatella balaenopterae]